MLRRAGGVARDIAAGAVRGAGSIGATLLTPIDAAARAMGVQNEFIGRTDRRKSMDAALAGLTGADTDSFAYGAGKLGAEVAGTLGVGGALAKGAALIPGAARAAPVVDAIRTAGMSAGGATGSAALAARTAGGAITGGASAALVDPETAAAGAAIGGALPGAVKLAGKAGQAIGGVVRGPAQSAEQITAIKAAQQSGYVLPPTQAKPSLANRLLEGAAGKITTAQNASAKNQAVTNALAVKALGLPRATELTPDVLKGIRQAAGQAYDAVGAAGVINPGAGYTNALDKIAAPYLKAAQGFPDAPPSPVLSLVDSLRSPAFDAASAVEKIKQLRTAADDAFRSGNTDIARAAKSASSALEDVIESHLKATNQVKLLLDMRDARQLIAKTYSVEKAMNPATGAVDARKLAKELAKGKPLSGELKAIARFGATFPKAAQPPEGMGSLPQWSPLDLGVGGGLTALTANPLMLGAMPVVRGAARAAALSPMVQGRLAQQSGPMLPGVLQSPLLQSLGYQAAPVTGSSGL